MVLIFRTIFAPFETVLDVFGPFSDRFGPFWNVFGQFWMVLDRFRTVSDLFSMFSDCFRTVSDEFIPNLKIPTFNWPGLGHRRGRPPFRPVGADRHSEADPNPGQLKMEILRKN